MHLVGCADRLGALGGAPDAGDVAALLLLPVGKLPSLVTAATSFSTCAPRRASMTEAGVAVSSSTSWTRAAASTGSGKPWRARIQGDHEGVGDIGAAVPLAGLARVRLGGQAGRRYRGGRWGAAKWIIRIPWCF